MLLSGNIMDQGNDSVTIYVMEYQFYSTWWGIKNYDWNYERSAMITYTYIMLLEVMGTVCPFFT